MYKNAINSCESVCLKNKKSHEMAKKTATKSPKTDRMEVRRDGFDEDSDFDVEAGLRWPKVSENGPKLFEKFQKN